MKAYLVKRKTLLQSGLKENGSDTIIPFDNINVEIGNDDPTQVVLPSLGEVARLVNEAVRARFEVAYTYEFDNSVFANPLPTPAELLALYNTPTGIVAKDLQGNDVVLTSDPSGTQLNDFDGILAINEDTGQVEVAGYVNGAFSIDQTQNSLPELIGNIEIRIDANEQDIVDLQNQGAVNRSDIDGLENVVVKTASADTTLGSVGGALIREDKYNSEQALQNDKLTALESADTAINGEITDAKARLTTIEGQQTTQDGLITNNANNIATNVQNITDLDTRVTDAESRVTAVELQANGNEAKANMNEQNINFITPTVDANQIGVSDYFDNKAGFLRVDDVQSFADVVANPPIAVVRNGDIFTFPLSTLDTTNFLGGETITSYLTSTSNLPVGTSERTIEVRDSFDNTSGTQQIIALDGKESNVTVTISAGALVIDTSGIGAGEKDDLETFSLRRLIQIGALGGGADLVARQAADNAQSTANEGLAKANTNETNITTLSGRVTTNETSINTLTTNVGTNTTNIATNLTKINANTTKANTNATNIATNTGNISTNTTNIADNTTDIATNRQALNAKQDAVDNSLTTTTKSVVGAINEVKTFGDTTRSIASQIAGVHVVTGGTTMGQVPIASSLTDIIGAELPTGVADISDLTTEQEVFNAVEIGKKYLISIRAASGTVFKSIVTCAIKTATSATLTGADSLIGFTGVGALKVVVSSTGTDAPSSEYTPISVGDPTNDTHAVTLKYFNDNIPSGGGTTNVRIPSGTPSSPIDIEYMENIDWVATLNAEKIPYTALFEIETVNQSDSVTGVILLSLNFEVRDGAVNFSGTLSPATFSSELSLGYVFLGEGTGYQAIYSDLGNSQSEGFGQTNAISLPFKPEFKAYVPPSAP